MKNETKQTAVEWFNNEILSYKHSTNINGTDYIMIPINKVENLKEQAKEMEKEQIAKAFDDGDYNYHYSRKTGNDFENGEEYFEELYGGNK